MCSLDDTRQARRGSTFNASDTRQPLRQEGMHMFIRSKHGRGKDIVAAKANSEKADLVKFSKFTSDLFNVLQLHLNLDNRVDLIADLQRVDPCGDLDDASTQECVNAISDSTLGHLKSARKFRIR